MQDEYLEEKMKHFQVNVCACVCYGFVFCFEGCLFSTPNPNPLFDKLLTQI